MSPTQTLANRPKTPNLKTSPKQPEPSSEPAAQLLPRPTPLLLLHSGPAPTRAAHPSAGQRPTRLAQMRGPDVPRACAVQPSGTPLPLTSWAHMAARSPPRSNRTASAAEISGRNPRRDHDGRAPRSPAPPINPRGTPPTSTLPRSTAPIPSRLATQLRRAEQRAAPPRPRPIAAPESRPRSVSTPPGPPGTSQSFYPRLRPL